MISVPVVFACDDAYAMPFAVALQSMLRHQSADTFYQVYCLVPAPLSSENQARIDHIATRHTGYSLTFICMDAAFQDASLRIPHISHVTYYRLNIPSLLPQHDCCIYLDVDLVIRGDLASLLASVTHRGQERPPLLAGVPHPEYAYCSERQGHPIVAGKYVNAGVVVMNLKAMREEQVEQRFAQLMMENLPMQDQDVLNVACRGRISMLDVCCNFMPKLMDSRRYGGAKAFYAAKGMNLDAASRRPCIIHYANKFKPWKFRHLPWGKPWQTAYASSVFGDVQLRREDYRLRAFRRWAFKIPSHINNYISRQLRRYCRRGPSLQIMIGLQAIF